MKTLISFALVSLLLLLTKVHAQDQYTIGGIQYSLFTEVKGPLTLLWNTVDGEYRYFSKKEDVILELTNTSIDGTYQDEFKETLRLQTADIPQSLEKVELTPPSLSAFFVKYNKAKDPNFSFQAKSIKLKTRLAVFGGFTNNVFNKNPTNAIAPVAGVDFEIIDNVKLRRHSIVLRFKQTFENSDTKSSSSQFSLNYRFKFIQTTKFDAFVNAKFVAYTYSNREFSKTTGPANAPVNEIVKESGGNLSAPAAFGIGADYAIGNGYITFSYNDIFALGVTSNGAFPADFTLGYKFNL